MRAARRTRRGDTEEDEEEVEAEAEDGEGESSDAADAAAGGDAREVSSSSSCLTDAFCFRCMIARRAACVSASPPASLPLSPSAVSSLIFAANFAMSSVRFARAISNCVLRNHSRSRPSFSRGMPAAMRASSSSKNMRNSASTLARAAARSKRGGGEDSERDEDEWRVRRGGKTRMGEEEDEDDDDED